MFAQIKQKWDAFKAKWKEYQSLRRFADQVWENVESAAAKITLIYEREDELPRNRCMRIKLMNIPAFRQDLDFPLERPVVFGMKKYCPYFDVLNKDNTIAECTKTECPCYSHNHEYVAAIKKYSDAVGKCHSVWQRSKSK